MAARIGDGNQINVSANGFRRVSLWFGQKMVDLGKPVTIRFNLRTAPIIRKVAPSVEILLEDLYLRGDRQRVYWAKVEIPT
jgi:hypothetical protein